MSFLPKTSLFGKIFKKISPLTIEVNVKIYFKNFPQTISFCIKKPIQQQSLNINPFQAGDKKIHAVGLKHNIA